jgi:polyisoprenoid-binding protein YceI
LTLDESNLANSRVEALIEAASLETRDAQRDAHLKSADFFDVEKFPRCPSSPRASAWSGMENWPLKEI